MAKEQVHNYIRTFIALAVVVFAGGGYAMKINSNSSDIVEVNKKVGVVDVKIGIVKDDIHRIELNAKDIQSLATTAVRHSAEAKAMFGKVMDHLEEKAKVDTQMQIKMGKIETKVDTLIKG
jgi:hypothetical protein